jgi:UMF1 family MFS transporter
LRELVGAEDVGKLSGLGWALGYFGGLVCLALVLFGFIGLAEVKPWFDLPREESEYLRIVPVFVAVWVFLFALPFTLGRDRNLQSSQSLAVLFRTGWHSFLLGLRKIFKVPEWRNILIGSALYRDGLSTVFAFGGIYAATQFGFTTPEILIFAILLNVTAGIGCVAAAFFEDCLGSLKTIKISLLFLIVSLIAIVMADDKMVFYILALFMGLFMGPVQSATRSLILKVTEVGETAQSFGFYAMTGKAIAFVGPLLFALATDYFGDQKYGLATIIVLFMVGFLMIFKLKDKHDYHT